VNAVLAPQVFTVISPGEAREIFPGEMQQFAVRYV